VSIRPERSAVARAKRTQVARGKLLWEYAPPRAHPIVYAGALLFAFVFMTGSIENVLRENRSVIYLVYALPLLVTAFMFGLFYPSNTRVYANGIAPSRPMVLRWHRPFSAYVSLAAIYPSYYDVTGAFVSPFASSDGKVTQMGLGLEQPDGSTETIRFTPSRFTMWATESRGYLEAMDVVKEAWGDRPLVDSAETFTPAEQAEMIADAGKPFLPFIAIVLLFASGAPVLWVLTRLGAQVWLALIVALLAPIGVSLRSFSQSERRHSILNRLSKAAQFKRQQRD
jgi:hypothetical protein